MFCGDSLDCLDSYTRQTVTFEVLLQWTNHLAKESMKRPRLYIEDPASLFIDRHHAPDDASSRPPEGAREVFSEEMIGDFRRATASPFQGCGCQTSCSCNSSVGRALSLGFEADTAPAQTSCTCVPGRSDPRL